jgi:hypothetical protein
MDPKQQEILDKLKSSNNILVTVSANPSVDQLAACIGLTLLLNKLGKHATAVFSGDVPSTIEFLKPDDTLEKNTDSLRDFIISLDKAKADKLRYKVEDRIVKIFITPYRTSLSSDDLNFSQGDFNIDVVLTLGVHEQTDLDQAITAHGRILHDAVVMSINNTQNGELGSVNWQDTNASSLCELVTRLAKQFDKPLLDEQIATALLTGIVAETDRFRNDKTSASTMSASADLLAAGANQQLVAHELENEIDVQGGNNSSSDTGNSGDQGNNDDQHEPPKHDGTLEISHPEEKDESTGEQPAQPEQPHDSPNDEQPELPTPETDQPYGNEANDLSRPLITEAPTLGGHLTANTMEEDAMPDPSMDALTGKGQDSPLLTHDQPAAGETPQLPSEEAPTDDTIPPQLSIPSAHRTYLDNSSSDPSAPDESPSGSPAPTPAEANGGMSPSLDAAPQPPLPPVDQPAPPAPEPDQSLTEQEEPAINQDEQAFDRADEVDKAREEVMKAISGQTDGALPPIEALNAQPVELGNRGDNAAPAETGELSLPNLPDMQPEQAPGAESPADQAMTMPLPPSMTMPPAPTTPPTNADSDPNAPPPVPPPLTPPAWPPSK